MSTSHSQPEKKSYHVHPDGASSITRAGTGSHSIGEHVNEKVPIPDSADTQSEHRHQQYLSPGLEHQERHQAERLTDDLTVLQAEQAVSDREREEHHNHLRPSNSRISRERSREPAIKEDVFNAPRQGATIDLGDHEPPNKLNKIFKRVKKLPRIIRYFLYALPITAVLLTPILLGTLSEWGKDATVGGDGGVKLMWFGIWLEVIWLSLWLARIVTAVLPFIMHLGAKIVGSGNPKKWKIIGLQMELPTALFFWMMAVLISFMPLVNSNRKPTQGDDAFPELNWISVLNKIIISLFVLVALNFLEKIIIQWIAHSFHLRTYSSRIADNKQHIAYLVHIFIHSKDRLVTEESVTISPQQGASGIKTPMKVLQNNARHAMSKVGDVANRVAGDFTGREVRLSNHPRKVVTELLRTSTSARVLARRLFRTYAQPGSDVLLPPDLSPAFPTAEDAEAAFNIFDRDLNGDVSIEELEAFCDEVHREKKAIAASLKDLDSVITKLDQVFLVVVIIITIVVFISIISSSAYSALSSAGTAVLGLSWLLQATAQEFLQSVIFVFVKHPFDVGDRITVYGNTGTTLTGDDYYVTEISLLFTEFKKMEGHIVQAPNSILNTLFILNHRRSGTLADVFKLVMRHGTPSEIIHELAARMEAYVLEHRRDFTSKIITELSTIDDGCSIQVNLICFHKTSFQNELLRLTRHNKFALELAKQLTLLGIEQPRQHFQISGGSRDSPLYQANIQPPGYSESSRPPPVDPAKLTATRRRAESRSHGNAVDHTDAFGDVWELRKPTTNAPNITSYAGRSGMLVEEEHRETSSRSALNLQKVASGGASSAGRSLLRRSTTMKGGHSGSMV